MNAKRWISCAAVTLAAAGFCAPAFAADLSPRTYTKAPMMVPPQIFSWTGFYIGGQVGYDWRDDNNLERFGGTGIPDGWAASSKPHGVVGGGHVGYNLQTGAFVFGVEADFEGADIKGTGFYSLLGAPAITDHITSRTDWQGSLRGRLGFAVNNVLFYGTGGLAFADIKHDYVTGVAGPPITSFSQTRTGWTAGAGMEYGFSPNWSARVEYRYSDFGKLTNNVGAQFLGALQDQKITDNSVRLGISYRWGGPVVANY